MHTMRIGKLLKQLRILENHDTICQNLGGKSSESIEICQK